MSINMKLKIFSERSYLPEGINHDSMLSPFWGRLPENALEEPDYPWTKRFVRYAEMGCSFFEMTSLEEADLAVVPINWMAARGNTWRTIKGNKVATDLAIQFAKKAQTAGKQVVVFFAGDCSDEKIPVKNALIFRESLYRSAKKATDFAIPAFNEDIVEHYFGGQITIREKPIKPTVGFCGYAKKTPFIKETLKNVVYHSVMLTVHGNMGVPPSKGHSLRSQALDTLSKSQIVDTNFSKREGLVFLNEADMELKKKLRMEFLQNMIGSDYVLCCRGAGNFSFRFNEALCCGRIPILINTDCVLPYDFVIDWKKYCVWVDEKEIPLIAEKVAEFHNNLSPQDFVDLQHECRKLWKQWICPEGFFANFYRHFQVSEVSAT